ncbi:MAG TPA: hypothetical protein VHA11_13420 [Bryobacteraceae bacterium]|nr:hypothetical protein [Bryobacteraceae bacterium]
MIAKGVFVAAMAALALYAQDEPAGATVMAFQTQKTFNVQTPGPGPDHGPIMFVRTEMAGADKMVKGVPFSAEVVTEFTQTLADGNAIRRNQTGTLARDSEGRTRREQPMAPLGPISMPLPATHLVFINDPVAGVTYVLDTDKKTAQKLPLPKPELAAKQAGETAMLGHFETGATVAGVAGVPAVGHIAIAQAPAESADEGADETRMIEGVRTVGHRTVHTIPAGEVGNDRPIETVSERWYSPELETVILSKHSDPRMGETVYRLTNINRGEPSPSLFEVPADYKVVEGGPMNVNYRIKRAAEGKETK